MIHDSPKVADYFVSVGLNDLKKPESDGDGTLEPITDLAVIFKSLGEEPPPGYECIEFTPSGLQADLNHGSFKTQTCYLCFKRGRDKPPLKDIGVLYEGKQRLMQGCDVVHKTPTKQVANVNNANNMRIFITYRRASPQFAHSSLAVIDICVIIKSKGEKVPHAFCVVEKTLNQGLVGSDVYLCYRKSLARSNSLSYPAEIISRYPFNDLPGYPLPDSVSLFCLPLGAVIEFWPEGAPHPLPIFSTFALTGATGEKIYGAGVTFFEEFPRGKFTDDLHQLLELQQKTHKDKRLVAQTNKCICLLSRYPFFDAFRKFLMSLYRITLSGKQTLPIERYISHFMHNVPFPTPKKPIVYVQITHEGFEITEPSQGPIPTSGASFVSLLRCLGSENCLVLLYCILTEQKILIHSLRPALLTSVGEALTSLIFPFQWKCPYIPLCPLKLADVLFAPFPFIYGVDSRYFDQCSPPSDVTCVDLDTNTITQAVEKNEKAVTWRALPKKPGKMLKDRLDELFQDLYNIGNEQSSAVSMAPLDDLTAAKRKKDIETKIQESFLRFHAQILKGYKQFLLPITSRPDIGSRDLRTLFDLDEFVKSRLRGTEKFFQMLTKTQLFSHFIESRSLSSSNDAVLAFFDECCERCEVSSQLLRSATSSTNSTTVVVTPPDLTGLPPGEEYVYTGFPKLRPDLFTAVSPVVKSMQLININSTPPRSPVVGRTVHERLQGSMSAKKQANSPTLWARCLLGHCYTLWFIHLPSYFRFHQNEENLLFTAFEVLQKISKSKAKLPDEVCYRVLMQLSGQFNHPALAVKTLFEMKRVGIQPNAVTWGYYHKAVLEGEWLQERAKRSPKQLWCRLRVVVMAMYAFRKGITKKYELLNFDDSDEVVKSVDVSVNDQVDMLVPIGSVGTSSANNLSNTGSMNRNQPIAEGLNESNSTDFSDITPLPLGKVSSQLSNVNGHKRNLSFTSESSEHDEQDFVLKSNLMKHSRKISQTSTGSNLSDPLTSTNQNNHIMVAHQNSWEDVNITASQRISTSDLYDVIGPSVGSNQRQAKRNVALEAIICSCQICAMCEKAIYDEDVMGAWSADDSNLNIVCPFCQAKRVPSLQISVKDYRGFSSKGYCSSNSLNSDKSLPKTDMTASTPTISDTNSSSADPFGIFTGTWNNTTGEEIISTETTEQAVNTADDLEQFLLGGTPQKQLSSKPMVIKKLSRDLNAFSNSAPTSTSSSPVHGSPSRASFFKKHRKTSSTCSSNTNTFIEHPEEKLINCVPYLSPLVLRKELENLLANSEDGGTLVQTPAFVDEKPIIYWNLVWFFCRLGLESHLPSLLLQSYSEKSEITSSQQQLHRGEVVISTSWDIDRQRNPYAPLYMLWNIPHDKQEPITENDWTPRSVLTSIASHVQRNDVVLPMKMLLDERARQQKKNSEIKWSLYRELMFLSLISCGTENIDINAFDREYKVAYREIVKEHSEKLFPDDKPPNVKAVHCRIAFGNPRLQPKIPRLTRQ